MIHTVKGFSVVNEAEVGVFLEFSFFLHDLMNIGNLISGSSTFSSSVLFNYLSISAGSWKKQESSRKTSISASLTMPKPLTVWLTINWKILKEMGIPDHLTCLLRNLCAGQETTVRTGHGTTDWFQIGKGVRQG